MLFVRSKMPESRLWQEFKRRESAGELPPEKLAQSTPLIEIFKGVSLRYVIVGVIVTGGYIIAYQCISIFMPTLILRDLGGNLPALRAITLWFAAVSAVGMIGGGYLSDAYGRRASIIVFTLIGIAGLIAIHSGSATQVSRRLHELEPVLGLSASGASARPRSASSGRGSPSFIRSRCGRPRPRRSSTSAGWSAAWRLISCRCSSRRASPARSATP